MGSESDEIVIEDSDDSLLDFKELNDLEFDLPHINPPSLESVLWDMESEEGSDSASLHSIQSATTKFHSMLCHCILQGISAQISSAGKRVRAGLPTCITNSLKFVAVGTSHGYVLAFDTEQNLCWCYCDANSIDQGAVSALAFNLDSTRLLVGYERGLICMIDATNGDTVRKMPEAHAPQTAVLHLRFTFLNNLALVGDSSGCVFSLSFNRRLGVRTWDSKCLFSGARGEVCVFEPLIQANDIQFLNNQILVAMATLSKVIVITIRPRLRVLFSQQLPRVSSTLPLISWQLVSVGRTLQPVLAWGRCNELNYTRVTLHGPGHKIRLLPLRSVQLPYSLLSLHWLGSRHLALLDAGENLRLVEVRTQRELEVLELANAGLVYSSAHFKALAVGGGVSEAFALAGERACYNSLSSRGDQLLILGTKTVHMIKLRTWPERLLYLSGQGKWAEALNLAADEGFNREQFTTVLLMKYLDNLNQNYIDKDSLTAAVNCCVKLNKIDILCNDLLEAVSADKSNLNWYFSLITDHIINGLLLTLTPTVSQMLINHLIKTRDPKTIENVLLNLDITCLDLHQVLSLCKKQKLYDAWIRIITKTTGDYASPLIEFLSELNPDNHRLGNTMLVYVSSCLAGLGYPTGNIPDSDVPRVKHEILRCLETTHSINVTENELSYPYLRGLLKYNTRECLNVVELAFKESEFSGEMGQLQKQRLIQILLQIVQPPQFSDSQVVNLACFVSRLVTSNSLTVEGEMMDAIVEYLTNTNNDRLNLRDHAEREQAWLNLLSSNQLGHFDSERHLRKALESKCYRVAEFLYETQKNYAHILECYLNDTMRSSDAFNYILNYIGVKERCIKEQFIINFKQLIAINGKKSAEIVLEHFSDQIEQFSEILNGNDDLQCIFLREIVSSCDIKLPPHIAETYLKLLCAKGENTSICAYVKLSLCRIDQALNITKKYEIHAATALLLEQSGEWMEALQLLLEHDMIDEAVNVCIKGVDHLHSDDAQALWLTLLRHKRSAEAVSLRQLLHAAAPHVPPNQLLELVSNASFGDVRGLLQGMLTDYTYDVEMLSTTLKLLGKDLHHILAKSLCLHGKGVSVTNTCCKICNNSLSGFRDIENDQNIAIWGCGHCFHSTCMQASESIGVCPTCRLQAKKVEFNKIDIRKNQTKANSSHVRPDLEGHF